MHSSKVLYIILISLATTSCSSLYDVWQGYDNLDPIVPEAQYQVPQQTRSEIDDVVVQTTLDTMLIQNKTQQKEITTEELEKIYEKAEKELSLYSLADLEIPEKPQMTIEDIKAKEELFGTNQEDIESLISSEIIKTTQTKEATEDEVLETTIEEISENTVEPITEMTTEDDGDNTDEIYQPLIEEENITTNLKIDEVEENPNIIITNPVTVLNAETQNEPVKKSSTEEINAEKELEQLFSPQDIEKKEISLENIETITISEPENKPVIPAITFLLEVINYNKGSDRLSPRDVKVLAGVTEKYLQNPTKIKVVAYAVSNGNQLNFNEAMNLMDLAMRRAEKVTKTLENQGVDNSDITFSAEAPDKGHGSSVNKGDITEIFFEY